MAYAKEREGALRRLKGKSGVSFLPIGRPFIVKFPALRIWLYFYGNNSRWSKKQEIRGIRRPVTTPPSVDANDRHRRRLIPILQNFVLIELTPEDKAVL
jgi:hypothetical protein